jgi:murein L,D-transpeptidase YcbB/YkuD
MSPTGLLNGIQPRKELMSIRLPSFVWAISLGALMAQVGFAAEDEAVRRALQERVEHLMFVDVLEIEGEPLLAGGLIAQVYGERDYRPAWRRGDALAQLRGLVALAQSEGLPAADYPLANLQALQDRLGGSGSPADIANFDLLATELLIRVAYHMRFGKVDPGTQDPSWNFKRELRPSRDPAELLDQLTAEPNVADALTRLFPRGWLHERAKETLSQYRALLAAGGWPPVSEGPVLSAGDRGPRVAELRARLRVTGELDGPSATEPELFDETLSEAVTRFQRHHGLDADGAVGQQTLTAMNVDTAHRIGQLRLTLERGRWIMNELDQRFVLVNIAGFYAALVEDRKYLWYTPVQVGTPYRKTPVFRGEMEYLVLNPTWVVPPGILRKDILPKLAKDPGYLQEKNFRVLDRSWNPVDASAIDWSTMSARAFPYIIEQGPGPTNALGRVKFIFPNSHFVFLHDTPSQNLFERASRSFSSGCIRVKDPLELARLLLDDETTWNAEQIQATLDAKSTRTVHLREPLPVLLLYWTADFHPETGEAYFYDDIYSRDAKLLNALNGDVSIKLAPPS